jgi:transposase
MDGNGDAAAGTGGTGEIVACAAEQCTCGQCGQQTQLIGYEQTEVLDVRPAEYFVTVIKREKRACQQCAHVTLYLKRIFRTFGAGLSCA